MQTALTVSGGRTHREFSPSQSERFILCPGSINLLKRTPDRERTKYAEEGERAHTVLAAGLSVYAKTADECIDASIHFAESFPTEFKAAINTALEYVYGVIEYVNATYGDAVLYVETYVNPHVQAAPGEAAGYCDVAIYSAEARMLWVADYKHGEGVVKEIADSSQVKQYAAGFLFGDQDERVVDPAAIDTVICAVIQPRAFHPKGQVREIAMRPAELVDYLLALDGYIEAAQAPDAPLIPGLEQCRFCEARSVCPALESRALAVVNPKVSSVEHLTLSKLPDPRTLDVHRLAYVKQSFEILRVWMNGVDSHIDELVRAGQVVPGFKLVEDHAKRHWNGENKEQLESLADLIGCKVDDLYDVRRKPLTTVESMMVDAFKQRVGAGKKKQAAQEARQAFAWFTIKQNSGNLVLVTEDDPRPPANKALSNFEQLRNVNITPP